MSFWNLFRKKPSILKEGNISATEHLEGLFKGSFSVQKDGEKTDLLIRKCPYGEESNRFAFCVFKDEGCGFSRRSKFYTTVTDAFQFLCDNFSAIERGEIVVNKI